MKVAGQLWAEHGSRWRRPAEVLGLPHGMAEVDRRLLRTKVRGRFWETLGELGIVLLVTREYEHLVMALTVSDGDPRVTYLSVAHPTGMAATADGRVYLASTRNPNQVFELKPVRTDTDGDRPLMPVRSWLYPGSLYLHDLAMVGDRLHANAVGENAVVALPERGGFERVWWPRCVEDSGSPRFDRNLIQLNSIAAGSHLKGSYFTASTDRPSARRPGHRNFAVDRQGVVFHGGTRETVARGLTRPHSARQYRKRLWVDDSGYGRLVTVDGSTLLAVTPLPGWTRGLAFRGSVAFVGTSRVLPRFRHYAPGLDADHCECAVHAVDLERGTVIGSLIWPAGNQIFAIECLAGAVTSGLPCPASRRAPRQERDLFHRFDI